MVEEDLIFGTLIKLCHTLIEHDDDSLDQGVLSQKSGFTCLQYIDKSTGQNWKGSEKLDAGKVLE